MKAAITEKKIKATKPTTRRMYVWDDDLEGFGLVVHPSGRRVFVVRYRRGDGRRRRAIVGTYPAMPVKDARDRAKTMLAGVVKGADPLDAAAARRAMPTFGTWAREYVTEIKTRKKRPEYDEYFLVGPRGGHGHKPQKSTAMTLWETLPLDAVSVTEVKKWRAAFTATTRKGCSGTTTANRAYAALRACLQAAVNEKILTENPCAFVKKYPENKPRERTLSAGELRRVLAAVDSLNDPLERGLFRLIIETGCRKSEALQSRWIDFDLDGDQPLWTIPSPKAGTPQTVPLPAQTAAMVAALPHIGAFVFPGKLPGTHRVEVKKSWHKILKAAEVEGVNVHDCRRTYGLAVALSAGILAASKLLRHSSVAITGKVYAPLAAAELRPIAEKVVKRQGKVLPMRNRKVAAR